jgi:phosphodiesterase/alkaline phosphatase D-like protein
MPHAFTRRGLLSSAALAGVASAVGACQGAEDGQVFTSASTRVTGSFAHGIASGDPRSDSVILWTRITPSDANGGPVKVIWDVSPTEDFFDTEFGGSILASAANNWTAKVEVIGLASGTRYYYRFRLGEESSPVGQTQTLPEGDIDQVRFAVVSCSNWQHGYFNAYDHIARQDDIDAVIHLGDYFYEYGADGMEETTVGRQGRLHEPRHEVISLEDYRIRHAQYRTDPALQAMSAKFPMISIWDDHESSNDSWQNGAENHSPDSEGSWEDRKQAAMRAYYEWMPIRDPSAGTARENLFRHIEFGDLLSLVTVETRLTARAEPLIIENYKDEIDSEGGAEKFKAEVLGDPSREMFGKPQEDFIVEALSDSKSAGKTWRVLANQVIMGRLLTPDLAPYVDETAVQAIEKDWPGVRDIVELSKYNLPVYPDSWDGYPTARERFYERLIENDVQDIFVLTGDAHEFWMNDLSTESGEKVGVEVVSTAVSSETLKKYMGDGTADYALLLTQANKDARYYNPLPNGYSDITFTKMGATVRMMAVSDTQSLNYSMSEIASFTVKPKKGGLNISTARGLNLKQRALFSGIGSN